MKKLYYYPEKTKYTALFFLAVTVFLLYSALNNDKSGSEDYLFCVLCTLFTVITGWEGVWLLIKKKLCKFKGAEYDGRITGQKSFVVGNNYLYRFEILYKGGKFLTPYVQPRYAERLKSRNCKVYIYKKLIYVDGYTLSEKGEKGIEIQTRH